MAVPELSKVRSECMEWGPAVAAVARPRVQKHECQCRRVACHRVSHQLGERRIPAGRRWWWQPGVGGGGEHLPLVRGGSCRGPAQGLEFDRAVEGLRVGRRETVPACRAKTHMVRRLPARDWRVGSSGSDEIAGAFGK